MWIIKRKVPGRRAAEAMALRYFRPQIITNKKRKLSRKACRTPSIPRPLYEGRE